MSANKRKAFTLIELLVVVSIIALLVSVLIPALSTAKQLATGTVCLTNQKGLIMAWRMYADDNADRIVNGDAQQNEQNGYDRSKRGAPWVGVPIDENGDTVNSTKFSTTFADRLRGLRKGALGSYTGQAAELYHCPGDNREVLGTRHGHEPRYQIYRSYSITRVMSTHAGPDGNLEIFVLSDVRQPGSTVVFVEMAYDGGASSTVGAGNRNYNSGRFNFLGKTLYAWWAPLAQFHHCATTFSFADGHAEMRKWVEERTCEYHKDRWGPLNTIFRQQTIDNGQTGDSPDMDWMIKHIGGKYK